MATQTGSAVPEVAVDGASTAAVPDGAAMDGGEATTDGNGQAMLGMFASQPLITRDTSVNDLDLDDLFRECYFNELPVIPTSIGPADPPDAEVVPAATGLTETGTKRKADEVTQSAETNDFALPDDEPSSGSLPVKELTEAQKIERRERNREHAKRSRLRKKFLLESLQEQIYGLQGEIEQLKTIIKTELPEKAESLLAAVDGEKKENFTPLPMPSGFGPVKTLMEPDFRLMSSLSNSQQNFAISDPSLPDNPIVYCSQGFLELTGYTLDQVLGRNCRFLQGPGTDQSAVDVIRKGVKDGVDTSVCLLNYKADGTPFWNQFFIAALRDAQDNVVNFVGVQCEVSKAVVESQIKENSGGKKTS